MAEYVLVLDFQTHSFSNVVTGSSWVQAGVTLTDLANLPVSLDTRNHVELKRVRVYLERDVRPESMWSRSTSSGSTVCAPTSTEVFNAFAPASSSTSPPVDPTAVESFDGLRMSDIANNVEFFLGPPGPLLDALPKARPYSKACSLPNAEEYIHPKPRVVPPPKKAAASVRKGRGGQWVKRS